MWLGLEAFHELFGIVQVLGFGLIASDLALNDRLRSEYKPGLNILQDRFK